MYRIEWVKEWVGTDKQCYTETIDSGKWTDDMEWIRKMIKYLQDNKDVVDIKVIKRADVTHEFL